MVEGEVFVAGAIGQGARLGEGRVALRAGGVGLIGVGVLGAAAAVLAQAVADGVVGPGAGAPKGRSIGLGQEVLEVLVGEGAARADSGDVAGGVGRVGPGEERPGGDACRVVALIEGVGLGHTVGEVQLLERSSGGIN